MSEETAPKKKGLRIGLRWRFAASIGFITLVLMTGVVEMVRNEISATLEKQITYRGLALAHSLAFACVEPLQVASAEKTLDLMLVANSYIQSGGDEGSVQRLVQRPDLLTQAIEHVKNLGKRDEATGVQNEGILSSVIVNPAGEIEAFADVLTPREDWLDQMGVPYRPARETGLLGPGEEFRIWKTPERGGLLVIAVPVIPRGGDVAADPGTGLSLSPRTLGSVYLSMSLGLVDRAVAQALGMLAVVSAAILLLGMFSAIFLAGVFTGPISKLQEGVQAIAAGDFNQRIEGRPRSDEIGNLMLAFNDMAKGLQEREVMRGAFSSYVSKDLLQEIIKNPDVMKPGGTRKTATVLFSYFSIHDELASMAERLDPEVLVRIINDYLEMEVKLVADNHGYPDKFIGDALVAVWGVPLDTSDHAESAVRCAVGIKSAITEMNKQRARQNLTVTDISIGVNTGSLVVGSMGSEGRKLDYTVIGEDVNYAARLAGAGAELHGGRIWVGQSTLALIKDIAEYRDLGEMTFKGLGSRRVAEVTGINPRIAAAK